VITPLVAASLDYGKVSVRKAVTLVATTLISNEENLEDCTLSRSKMHRVRNQARFDLCDKIKENMEKDAPLIVHFGEKILPDLTGEGKVDRVAIIVCGGN
jgi:hypothetical protein